MTPAASGDEVFRQLQRLARAASSGTGAPVPTSEYLTRHSLESFLERLTRTAHSNDFVLKGGVLLAGYGFRRPTRDVDAAAVSATVTAEHIAEVVSDVVAVEADDGLTFDANRPSIQPIRDTSEYPGVRVRLRGAIGRHPVTVGWDISTGDPMVPAPSLVAVPRIMGSPIVMLGYAPETVVAEKAVTILERGITSTRWRDFVDIVQIARVHGVDGEVMLSAARAVARYRGVQLRATADVVTGYGAVGQTKWAAWRRKEGLQEVSEPDLDEQLSRVAQIVDPLFLRQD